MDPSVSGRGAEPVYRDRATGAKSILSWLFFLWQLMLAFILFSLDPFAGERISKDELLKATKKDEKPKVAYLLFRVWILLYGTSIWHLVLVLLDFYLNFRYLTSECALFLILRSVIVFNS